MYEYGYMYPGPLAYSFFQSVIHDEGYEKNHTHKKKVWKGLWDSAERKVGDNPFLDVGYLSFFSTR